MMNDAWVQRYAIRSHAAARLFCFAHAGGGASTFRLWHTALPADIEVCAVQLPGRENRLAEPPIADIPTLVASLVPAIRALADRPFAFFGHSMGAAVAAEAARTLQRSGGPLPEQLIVSARRPAFIADPDPPLAHLPNAEFVAELNRRYGGIPAEVMAHAELMALLLPGLRADVTALESFRPDRGPLLSIPVAAFGGMDDAHTPRAHLEAWKAETTGAFRIRLFPGGHFYLNRQPAALLDEVRTVLSDPVDRVAGSPAWG